MGFFSSKTKTVRGFDFFGLSGASGLADYYNMRHYLVRQSGGDPDIFMQSFMMYRRGLGSRYTSRKVQKLGFSPEQTFILNTPFENILYNDCYWGANRFYNYNPVVSPLMSGWNIDQKPTSYSPPCDKPYHPIVGLAMLGLNSEITVDNGFRFGGLQVLNLDLHQSDWDGYKDYSDVISATEYANLYGATPPPSILSSSTYPELLTPLQNVIDLGRTPFINVAEHQLFYHSHESNLWIYDGLYHDFLNMDFDFQSSLFNNPLPFDESWVNPNYKYPYRLNITVGSKAHTSNTNDNKYVLLKSKVYWQPHYTQVRVTDHLTENDDQTETISNGVTYTSLTDLSLKKETTYNSVDDREYTTETSDDGTETQTLTTYTTTETWEVYLPPQQRYEETTVVANKDIELNRKTRILGVTGSPNFYKITSWMDLDFFNVGDNIDLVGSQSVISSLYSEPMVDIKTSNGDVLIKRKGDSPIGYGTEDQERRMRFLEMMGQNFDSFKSALDSSTTKTVVVGLSIAPFDALESKAVSLCLFDFLSDLPGDWGSSSIKKASIVLRYGSELTASMSWSYMKKDGVVPDTGIKKWKVSCRMNRNASEVRRAEVTDIYESLGYSSAGKTVRQMHNEVHRLANSSEATEQEKEAWYNMPNSYQIRNSKTRTYFVVDCKEVDILAKTQLLRSFNVTNSDPAVQEIVYDILKYKELRVSPTYAGYYTNELSRLPSFDYPNKWVVSPAPENFATKTSWFPQQNSDIAANNIIICDRDSNRSIQFFNAKVTFEMSAIGYIDTIDFDSTKDNFRLPLKSGYLDHGNMYKRLELREYLSSCAVFMEQTTKIKWYQTSAFKWVITIVLIIIAVVVEVGTLGAGTSVSGAILSVAYTIAISAAVNYAFDYLEKEFDMDFGVIKDIVQIALAIYEGDFSTAAGLAGLKLADEYIKYELDHEVQKAKDLKEEEKKYYEDLAEKWKNMTFGDKSDTRTPSEKLEEIYNRENYLSSSYEDEIRISVESAIENFNRDISNFGDDYFSQPIYDITADALLNIRTVENAFPTISSATDDIIEPSAGDRTFL